MTCGVLLGIYQFVFPIRSEAQNSLTNKTHFLPLERCPSIRLGLSDAEYSDQLLGAKPKQKKKRIAGIDQDELLDPALLADPDSCFCDFKGVQIHHKICDAESIKKDLSQEQNASQIPTQTMAMGRSMILLHGFGASVFSWDRVMKPLAHVTGAKILAFDRPAFGLTSRVNLHEHSSSRKEDMKRLNPYSMVFSVLLTLYFTDLLSSQRAVLVGHSAGSLVAVDTYFEAPERVAALILVAPAILAPLNIPKVVKENQLARQAQRQDQISNSNTHGNLLLSLGNAESEFFKYVVRDIMCLMKGMGEMVNPLCKKALSAILRSSFAVTLTRMVIDKFGIAAVRNAWYDPHQLPEHVLRGYTKPLRLKGWDKALVEYAAAMLTDSSSESKTPLVNRLSEISCPVLIVTGDSDRLVPSWNAERLSQSIPGSCLEVIKTCGHLPHEEKVVEFVSIVDKFLHRVFGDSQEQLV